MGEVSLSFLQLFTSSLVNLIFFFSLTLSLLSCEKSVLHELVHGLCGSAGPSVEKQLRQVTEGVFFFPVACYLGRYFYTLAIGLVLRLELPFLLALFTLLLTLIPGLSPYPWIASAPWILKLVILGYLEIGFSASSDPWQEAEIWLFAKAAILFISQWQILAKLEVMAAQRSISLAPSWVTGLSVVCGFERFGLHAFFMAPLLVSLVILSFQLLSEANQDDDAEESKEGAAKSTRFADSPSSPGSAASLPLADHTFAKKLGAHVHSRVRAATAVDLS